METFGECIRAWMTENKMSAADLTKQMEYKSKTTLVRLLKGQSNYASCMQFFSKLPPDLSCDWKERFSHALLVERVGKASYPVLEALDRQLFSPESNAPATVHFMPSAVEDGGTVFVLGCPWEITGNLIDHLLTRDRSLHVIHYMTRGEVAECPALLPQLIRRIPDVRYQAALLEAQDLRKYPLSWNMVIRITAHNTTQLIPRLDTSEWQEICLPSLREYFISLQKLLETLPQASLYRYDQLKSGRDYIDFTRNAFLMERGQDAVIVKPTPGMQMMPAEAVISAFSDFLSEHLEPVTAARESLIYIFRERVDNFYAPGRRTHLVLSEPAMKDLICTGRMSDHFYAFRPFTHEERMLILQELKAFSCRKGNLVQFLPDKTWPVSLEAYSNHGALFYPSGTNYNAETDIYRELFLPGEDFYVLIRTYVQEISAFRGLKENLPEESFKRMR